MFAAWKESVVPHVTLNSSDSRLALPVSGILMGKRPTL